MILCFDANLIKGVTIIEIVVYPITNAKIRNKAADFAKVRIAMKMKKDIKSPLIICSIGLINLHFYQLKSIHNFAKEFFFELFEIIL